MDDKLLEQLENDIHNKVVAYEYSDAGDKTLSGFIITLLKVGKNAQEVNEELLMLVGTDYDSNLTEWIFTRKHELEAHASAPETSTPMQEEQHQPSEEQSAAPSRQTERMDTERPKSRMFSQALGGVLANDSKRPDYSSVRRRREQSRSRSRSPERRSTRYERPERTSRHEVQDTRRSTDVFSRIGNARGKSGDRPSVFDRLGESKPIDIPERHHSNKQERCKYWPNCKNGDNCTFVHPTTICPDFPNCPKKASECLGIHPELGQAALQPHTAKLPYPCKFFPYCNNPVCPYIHPIMPPQQAYFMQAQPSFPKVGQRVQIPCKNGDACTRPDCHFLHPKDAAYNNKTEVICKFDGACTRPNCFYKHTKENNTQNKVFINKSENTNARQFSVPEDQIEERITVGESADVIRQSEQPSASKDVDMDL
ncbi:CCCH-type zinc finger transcription factor [Mucor lusitanicus]|uniref:Zinc finger CCCH domain-containing protein 14 n=2 Tax=Mucor circinelloides f. lusitanicus TaxID=29924 RepID=A0A168MNR7_MUCCL|nr:CCCH-type zinc finger transcription factor [Mucor lusitanicus]OAD05179.1 CCCH-type zinc finger transcription factor [Mucor lusitanicus CBS 277.49]